MHAWRSDGTQFNGNQVLFDLANVCIFCSVIVTVFKPVALFLMYVVVLAPCNYT